MNPGTMISGAADWALRATLIALVAAVVLAMLRIRTARARHTVWAGVVVLLLVLPVFRHWGPTLPTRLFSVPPGVPTISRIILKPTRALPVSGFAPGATGMSESAVTPLRWSWPPILAAVYFTISGFLLLRLIVGTVLALRLVRESVVFEGKAISAGCISPVTVGWFRPVILLPLNWREWSADKLDAVLRHEGEHARWRDPLAQWLAVLNRAIFWFHPLAWWLERRLNLLAEEACDQAVLSYGARPADYANWLVQFAHEVASSRRAVRIAGMTMAGTLRQERLGRLFSMPAADGVPVVRTILAGLICCGAFVAIAAGTEAKETALKVLPVAKVLIPETSRTAKVESAGGPAPARVRVTRRHLQSPAAPATSVEPVNSNDNLVGAIYMDLASFPESARSKAIDSTAAIVARSLKPGYEVGLLVNRGSGIEAAQTPTVDRASLLNAINRVRSEGEQATPVSAANDAFTGFENAVEAVPASAGRKHIMWVVNQSLIADTATHRRWEDTLAAMERQGVSVMVAGIPPQSDPRP